LWYLLSDVAAPAMKHFPETLATEAGLLLPGIIFATIIRDTFKTTQLQGISWSFKTD